MIKTRLRFGNCRMTTKQFLKPKVANFMAFIIRHSQILTIVTPEYLLQNGWRVQVMPMFPVQDKAMLIWPESFQHYI